ncbi:unnamed protein product, partial [Sphacelaria rigidula]
GISAARTTTAGARLTGAPTSPPESQQLTMSLGDSPAASLLKPRPGRSRAVDMPSSANVRVGAEAGAGGTRTNAAAAAAATAYPRPQKQHVLPRSSKVKSAPMSIRRDSDDGELMNRARAKAAAKEGQALAAAGAGGGGGGSGGGSGSGGGRTGTGRYPVSSPLAVPQPSAAVTRRT